MVPGHHSGALGLSNYSNIAIKKKGKESIALGRGKGYMVVVVGLRTRVQGSGRSRCCQAPPKLGI